MITNLQNYELFQLQVAFPFRQKIRVKKKIKSKRRKCFLRVSSSFMFQVGVYETRSARNNFQTLLMWPNFLSLWLNENSPVQPSSGVVANGNFSQQCVRYFFDSYDIMFSSLSSLLLLPSLHGPNRGVRQYEWNLRVSVLLLSVCLWFSGGVVNQ